MTTMEYDILSKINSPADLKALPEERLPALMEQIRAFLCEKVLTTGGHLASNLGVVELTVALHRVFDSPRDRIIFDVGHQSYVHKLLTGRRESFDTLRTPGGLSGFTKRAESEHDPFGAGHSSTSVSAAIGFAEAERLSGGNGYAVAVLGDGAYTGGMVHEALNNCARGLKLIIILNENEMSISPNTGAFAEHISKLRASKGYYKTKRRIIRALWRIPLIGDPLYRLIGRIKTALKHAIYRSTYFEDLGLTYLGPVDGNDYDKVEHLLAEAKQTGGATIVHLMTKKGKGYAPAEESPERYHGVPPAGTAPVRNFSAAFGSALCALAAEDDSVCAITAAMSDGTGLEEFRGKYPRRFFDVGIAEEHAVTFAAGLAAAGKRPVFAVYSSFIQRAYDNILHDVALQRLPVVFCIDRASLSAGDGPTHHGIYDVALLNTVPGLRLYAPATFEKLESVLREALKSTGPVAIRYPNSAPFPVEDFTDMGDFRYDFPGERPQRVVITYGKAVNEVLRAKAEADFGIILLEKLKPYGDIARSLRAVLPRGARVIFLEEGVCAGGAAMMLKEELSPEHTLSILAIKDGFAEGVQGESLYKTCKISYLDLLEELKR